MLAGCLLKDIGLVKAVELYWSHAFVLEDLGFVFTSDEYSDWVFREVKLRSEQLG